MARIYNIAEKELIKRARQKDRLAQSTLYKLYAPRMLSVCRFYIKDLHFAEDVMIKGFFKAFTSLDVYENNGKFGAWIKKIMINQSLDFIRSKTHRLPFAEWEENREINLPDFSQEADAEEIQQMIDELPDGCKLVFNLYVLEGYKHREIAQELEITEGTSKSQLAYAKKCLQEKMKQKKQNHVRLD